MDAYQAVITLYNLGYQLMALEGDQVAIKPTAGEEHEELISAIRKEPQAACKAIQHLPQLCMMILPAELKHYAADLFKRLKESGYLQIVAIRFSKQTGTTEWVYVPQHSIARKTMIGIMNFGWEGVKYFECQEEGQ